MASFASSRSAQSRLKSRKVLGVGEGADGNIPRSKISQLLGHHEIEPWTLPTDNYPAGLRVFQLITCLYFICVGLITLIDPPRFQRYFTNSANEFDTDALVRHLAENNNSELEVGNLKALVQFPLQLYGVAMLSLATLFVLSTFRNRSNRRCVRVALAVEAFYFLFEIAATNGSSVGDSWLPPSGSWVLWMTIGRLLAVLLCLVYYSLTKSENGVRRHQD